MDADKEALKTDDLEAINAASDELTQAFSSAVQEVYQAQASEGSAEGDDGYDEQEAEVSGEEEEEEASSHDNEVVEAESEIVDEN
jgi:hypothetical protein